MLAGSPQSGSVDNAAIASDGGAEPDAAGSRRALHAERPGRSVAPSLSREKALGPEERGRARNTRCPVRMPQPGDSLAPTVCATPSMAPPTSVPHSEPSPPMITASKAKSSRSGPLPNAKVVRMPRKMPAMATMPSDSAMASA